MSTPSKCYPQRFSINHIDPVFIALVQLNLLIFVILLPMTNCGHKLGDGVQIVFMHTSENDEISIYLTIANL